MEESGERQGTPIRRDQHEGRQKEVVPDPQHIEDDQDRVVERAVEDHPEEDRRREQPSIMAASSSSLGMDLINP